MPNFSELLKGLDTKAALLPPQGPYTHGVGLAAHTLLQLLASPDTPPAARIAAVREVADRVAGRARVAEPEQDGDVRLSQLLKHRLDPIELDQLERLLLKAWPTEAELPEEGE